MGPRMGYTCPGCGFRTDTTNCDKCDGIVKWDDDRKRSAHCTGCRTNIVTITCRKCGRKFTR